MSPTALPFWLLWLHFFHQCLLPVRIRLQHHFWIDDHFPGCFEGFPVVEGNSLSFQGACFLHQDPGLSAWSCLYCTPIYHIANTLCMSQTVSLHKTWRLACSFDFRSWMDQAVWSTDIRAARRETHRFSTQNWDHTFFKWKCQNDSSVIFLALIHHF